MRLGVELPLLSELEWGQGFGGGRLRHGARDGHETSEVGNDANFEESDLFDALDRLEGGTFMEEDDKGLLAAKPGVAVSSESQSNS